MGRPCHSVTLLAGPFHFVLENAMGDMKNMPAVWEIELEDDGRIPASWQPYDVAVIAKCLNEQGKSRLALRTSRGWNTWELLGALRTFMQSIEADLLQDITDDPEDAGDDPE